MQKYFVFLGLFLFLSISALSQANQGAYLEAKRLFYAQDYISSQAAFTELSDDPTFGAYAGFYRGLIQYRLDSKAEAIILWKKLLSDYPSWEKNIEVLYWLSLTNFQINDVQEGLKYLSGYTNQSMNIQLSNELISNFMIDITYDSLVEYQRSYPDFPQLAKLLADQIQKKPFGERDMELLESLVKDHQLSYASLVDLEVENIKKEVYDIAVVLPFMFQSLNDPTATVRNALVMDLYHGIELALKDLKEDGKNFRVHLYDSYKEADTVALYADELKQMDLIIGPLYPGPIDTVKAISLLHKINMISPLTNNSSFSEGNPFSFLARPTYETMAVKLAEHVLEQEHQSTCLIYFSKDTRDSLFAEVYRSRMLKDSMEIVDFRSVDDLTAKYLLDTLTEQYEEYYPREVADSISEIEGRFIKTRSLREEEMEDELLDSLAFFEVDEEGKIINPDDPNKVLAYEMKYEVPKDTVGHILIVSRSMSIYNNFVSAKAARQDTMGIYGYSNWFDNKLVNYTLMDQVEAQVAVPDYYEKESEQIVNFSNRISNTYKQTANKYHIQGYETMHFVGRMMYEYGKYFQLEMYEQDMVEGVLMPGFSYKGSNDNQVVPIIKIEDLEIRKVN